MDFTPDDEEGMALDFAPIYDERLENRRLALTLSANNAPNDASTTEIIQSAREMAEYLDEGLDASDGE